MQDPRDDWLFYFMDQTRTKRMVMAGRQLSISDLWRKDGRNTDPQYAVRLI